MLKTIFLIINNRKYLSKKRKKQLLLNLVLMFLSGLSELLVINAVLPFLAVITNPDRLSNFGISKIIAKVFNIPLNGEVIIPFIFLFAFSVIISATIRISNLLFTQRLIALIGTEISAKTFSKNICQPYKFHLNNNTSQLITTNTIFVNQTVTAIACLLDLINSSILTAIISIAILFINPKLTITAIIIFSFLYLSIGTRLKKIINNNSQQRAAANQSLLKSLQEGLGSIRNILLESNQKVYIKNFRNHDWMTRKVLAKTNVISESPRYIIEALALLLICVASVFILGDTKDSSYLIIILGGFTIGIQRLLPNFQRIFNAWTIINTCKSDIENTLKILEMKSLNNIDKNIIPLAFKKSIKFDSVFFAYKGKECIVSDLNLEILKGQKIGIIGKTGSGKTTFSDILMGLLTPTKGKIYIDGKEMHSPNDPDFVKKWMKAISHVPQNIFLTDGSFIENIAFGVEKELISLKRVEACAKKAQIHEFINSTNDGYLTKVGERGIRISGGQRQRISIARALYHNAQILIFDEATSALDNNTEKDLLKAINKLSNEITIISIAHRVTTLKDYNRIFKIEKGVMVEVK